MRRGILSCTALLATLVVAGARVAGAQTVRYGYMGDSVTAQLRAAWSDDSTQLERAYCVQRTRISTIPHLSGGTDSIFRVLAVRPAVIGKPHDVNHVNFDCPHGTPELHTHTPATCSTDDAGSCRADGPLAFSCQPSRDDYEVLTDRGDQYGIIQCDRRAFRFYYPSDYVTPPQSARTAGSAP